MLLDGHLRIEALKQIDVREVMGSLQGEYRLIEDSYGPNVLNLTVAKTYLGTLLNNTRVIKYLALHHPEFLTQFQKIVDMRSLGGTEPVG
jgi:hypothetical protein